METIRQRCPQCQSTLELPASAVGRTARCPACQHVFPVSPAAPATPLPSAANPPPAARLPHGGDPFSRPQQPSKVDIFGNEASSSVQSPTNPYAMTPAMALSETVTVRHGELLLQTASIDDIISSSTAIFTARWQPLVIGGLITFAFNVVNYFVQQVISVVSNILENEIIAYGTVAFAQVTSSVLSLYLSVGLIRMALSVARGGNAEFSLLFPDGQTFLRCLGVVLLPALGLVGLAIGLGGIGWLIYLTGPGDAVMIGIAILGGLVMFATYMVAFFLLWPSIFLASDGQAKGMQALRTAYSIASVNKLNTFLLLMISIALSFVGVLMCCVGHIATTPATMLVAAVAYLLMTGQRLSDPNRTPPMVPNYSYTPGNQE